MNNLYGVGGASAADGLGDYSVVTTVGSPGADNKLPSEQAVREELNGLVTIATAQTITGTKGFSKSVSCARNPGSAQHLTTKSYVDSLLRGLTPQTEVLDRLADPPATPTTGDRYLIIATGSGDWEGDEDKLAEWSGSAWTLTTPELGYYVLDVSDSTGWMYNGTAWVSADTDQTPIPGIQNWTEIAASRYTATPSDTNTLAMSDTTGLATGLPVRYTISGTIYYGLVVALTANTSIDVAGAPLSGDVTKLEVGLAERTVALSLFVGGTFADGTEANLLLTDMGSPHVWTLQKAYLVDIRGTEGGVDSGTQPKMNVEINNAAVSTNDTNAGIQFTTAGAWIANGVAINTSNYDINFGEELEVSCTAAGGTGDAENATMLCTFVFE